MGYDSAPSERACSGLKNSFVIVATCVTESLFAVASCEHLRQAFCETSTIISWRPGLTPAAYNAGLWLQFIFITGVRFPIGSITGTRPYAAACACACGHKSHLSCVSVSSALPPLGFVVLVLCCEALVRCCLSAPTSPPALDLAFFFWRCISAAA